MIRRHKVIYDSADAGTGEWYELDSRYEVDATRSLIITMNASDTVAIQATVVRAQDRRRLEDIIQDEDIVTLESYTGATDVDAILNGNYTFIRVVKTGSNGNAKVQGFI